MNQQLSCATALNAAVSVSPQNSLPFAIVMLLFTLNLGPFFASDFRVPSFLVFLDSIRVLSNVLPEVATPAQPSRHVLTLRATACLAGIEPSRPSFHWPSLNAGKALSNRFARPLLRGIGPRCRS